ncbi:winged helix-turn-helix domain-containing protein [Spirochaetia bacterium 38H-sp]|uniref:Winged helix-turn-helix domain-containing protein n=1 Tax=Rarispira pelagica TaxID=3141764 RepID=A0ABU9U996_9SPIR
MIKSDGVAIFLRDVSQSVFLKEQLKKTAQYNSFFLVSSLEDAVSHPVCVITWEDFLSVSSLDKINSYIIVSGTPSNVAKAFSLGCADYLKEPWSLEELVARTSRFLRKNIKTEFLDIWFDNHKIVVNDSPLWLSPTRKNLLLFFLKNSGVCLPKGAIAMTIGSKLENSRAVDMQIAILRKELAACLPGLEKCIVSVTRKGYIFLPERFQQVCDCHKKSKSR